MNIIRYVRKLLCTHKEIRFWETEQINESGRIYDLDKYSCMKCGSDFYVRKRK